jgi:hypothetical protein
MSSYPSRTPDLHPTAICPGCETMVVLPAEVDETSPPAICGTCGAEIPDYRREAVQAGTGSYAVDPTTGATVVTEAEPEEEPVENRRYTRGGLFRALSDTVAEKGIAAIARRTPPGLGG